MYQPDLFGAAPPAFSYASTRRIALDERSWVDHGPQFLQGAGALFEQIVKTRPWKQRTRVLFDKEVLEPRLTAPWRLGEPLEPILEELRQSLSQRYRVAFDTIGFNYYRDGNDSVAWHRDQIRKEIREPIVALISLGEPRKLLLRPYQKGGASKPFLMNGGDLLVTGGLAQREWEHAIPKVAKAGPRVSLAFRHGRIARAYQSP
jgi:alkylated DNA repair dioxygenase AlkB